MQQIDRTAMYERVFSIS